ncbi:MAG: right-handed parallel beta-helix repeat-containing protein [Planctomycetota bacterium]|jgi:beta propeller repeat protein
MLRVAGVVILILCWHQSLDVSQAQFPIRTESEHQGRPDIWGDWIVWHDRRDGDICNIYGENLSSGEEVQISYSGTALNPSIHNGLVVWQDTRNGDSDIYCYNLITRTESVLYIASGNQVNPSIHGDTVVWRTGQYPSWPEVWCYSIVHDTAFAISDPCVPGNKWEPDVFADVVVWGDHRNGNWDVYGYDLTAMSEFAIATGPAYQRSVAVYGNKVVYENWRSNGNRGIGIYDLVTQEHTYHLTAGYCEWLNIYGTVVVWGNYGKHGTDIYGYRIFTGEEFPICTDAGWQYQPAIYRDRVVWGDDRDGGFSERDIYGATVPQHLYVDASASGSNDGSTWADAYNYLQDALAVTSSGDSIFVAAGTYKPDQGPNQTIGDRSATFTIVNEVAICGGFAGCETSFDQRDCQTNETILSGDINMPGENSDNSYHVVTGSMTNAKTILDGFTIRAGNANGSYPDDLGGGMLNNSGGPTITNCTFSANLANNSGGGMYGNSGSPTLSNCTFSGNSARDGAGLHLSNGSVTNCTIVDNTASAQGGGISSCSGLITDSTIGGNWSGQIGGGLCDCNGAIINCDISDNTAGLAGGGLHGCEGSVVSCTVTGNTANTHGGGIGSCSGPVINSKISGNFSGENGGGLYDCSNSIINCTISDNYAAYYGGGLHGCYGPIANCIVWLNTADIAGDQLYDCSDPTYSCIQDWPGSGIGNIVDDPCFVEPGYWADADGPDTVVEPNEPNAIWMRGLYHLLPGAPCIDRGDNASVLYDVLDLDDDGEVTERIPFDLDGNPRFADDPLTDDNGVPDLPAYPEIVDMGSYEYVLKIHNITQDTYHRTIQDAIDAAFDGDEIVVHRGIYTSYRNRDLNFDGKAITVRSTDPNAPDVIAATVINCRGSEADPHRGFSFHLGETADSVASGFTITNGYASEGGGIYCSMSSPTIRNCVIKDSQGGLRGGGIFLDESDANVIDCTISRNSTNDVGAGLYANLSSPEISNCKITANIAEQSGAGLWLEGGTPALTTCLITGNTAVSNNGGGLHGCNGPVINCTVSGNYAGQYGGGLYGCSGPITNCILWYNTADVGGKQLYSCSEPTYSCIQDRSGGVGNVADDPCFIALGYWGNNGTPLDQADDLWAEGDYHLLPASPCIDAGDPNVDYTGQVDIDGQPRVIVGRYGQR